ncbi:MAG: peptide chain release factor N(5)-glutamine methyltransferase [Devosia ginsengisoli]|nr:peptide chain release factor N(5)-glutamine methyltransferase [Devosia ginsengisoli]MCR6672109.1 peptide chain release factor N(5)-glutamine methyltransferase [Devosia ginsengisoli]
MLGRLGFESAALDAKLLTGHALGLSALDLALRENDPVDGHAAARVAELLQRRMTGESVARIIGEREFYGLGFTLNAATLEPRPETELLVDMALGALPAGGRLLDLGTGTGCIPIAVLANQPDASAVAVDLSALALETAQANAERHGVGERLELRQGDWFGSLEDPPPSIPPHKGEGGERAGNPQLAPPSPRWGGTEGGVESHTPEAVSGLFDLIVSNPPYITSAVVETLAPEVRDFDPRLALDGGPDGLAPYRVITAQAAHWLRPGGWVLVEIGHEQGADVSALFLEAGFEDVAVHRDLNGLDRVVGAHHL